MDLSLWPNIQFSEDRTSALAMFTLVEGPEKYPIVFWFENIKEDSYSVTVRKSEEVLFTFTDKLYVVKDQTQNYFQRTIIDNKRVKKYIYSSPDPYPPPLVD